MTAQDKFAQEESKLSTSKETERLLFVDKLLDEFCYELVQRIEKEWNLLEYPRTGLFPTEIEDIIIELQEEFTTKK